MSSTVSGRYTFPGITTRIGGFCVSITRICTVDVCVRKLRDKIDRRPGGYTYIQTHYSVGYRFDAMPKQAKAEATG